MVTAAIRVTHRSQAGQFLPRFVHQASTSPATKTMKGKTRVVATSLTVMSQMSSSHIDCGLVAGGVNFCAMPEGDRGSRMRLLYSDKLTS